MTLDGTVIHLFRQNNLKYISLLQNFSFELILHISHSRLAVPMLIYNTLFIVTSVLRQINAFRLDSVREVRRLCFIQSQAETEKRKLFYKALEVA